MRFRERARPAIRGTLRPHAFGRCHSEDGPERTDCVHAEILDRLQHSFGREVIVRILFRVG